MKAIGRYLIVKQEKEITAKTKGGLILAEKQREDIRYRTAEVISKGAAVEGQTSLNTGTKVKKKDVKKQLKETGTVTIKGGKVTSGTTQTVTKKGSVGMDAKQSAKAKAKAENQKKLAERKAELEAKRAAKQSAAATNRAEAQKKLAERKAELEAKRAAKKNKK